MDLSCVAVSFWNILGFLPNPNLLPNAAGSQPLGSKTFVQWFGIICNSISGTLANLWIVPTQKAPWKLLLLLLLSHVTHSARLIILWGRSFEAHLLHLHQLLLEECDRQHLGQCTSCVSYVAPQKMGWFHSVSLFRFVKRRGGSWIWPPEWRGGCIVVALYIKYEALTWKLLQLIYLIKISSAYEISRALLLFCMYIYIM